VTRVLLGAILVFRASSVLATGSSFGEPLRLPQSAWAQGMGNALAASGEGVAAIGMNPAGVLTAGFTTFHLTHSFMVTGVSEDYFAYAQPLPMGTSMGLSLFAMRTSGGTRELEDTAGNWAGSAGTYPVMFMAGSAAWAMDLRWLLPGMDMLRPSGGVGLRILSQQVDRDSWLGVSGDIGVRVQPGSGFGGGLVLQHVGVDEAGYGLPRQFVGALSWRADRLLTAGDGFLLEVDAPIARDRGFLPAVGGEYRIAFGSLAFAFRGGYREELSGTGASGISAGIGFRWLGRRAPWGLDYAVVPMGTLGTRHAVSLTIGMASAGRQVEAFNVTVEEEQKEPVRVFYPTKGERVYLPIRLREPAEVSAKLLDESGLAVTILLEPAVLKAGRHEIGWDGQISPGVWAQFDRTYHIFVQAGNQSFYLDCVPKTE